MAPGCSAPEPPPPAAETVGEPSAGTVTAAIVLPLRPGEPQEGRLAPGEAHAWSVELPAASLAAIEIDSLEIDLVATLRDGGGDELAVLATPASNFAETLLATTESAATLLLEVRQGEGERAPGAYRLELADPRPASAADPERLAAQRSHAEGLALSTLDREESNRRALASFEQALAGWRRAADRAGTARSLHWTALMLKDLNRYDEAEARLLEARQAWREIASPPGEAETLYRLGALYRLWGRFEAAHRAFDGALPLFRQAGDRAREARTLYNQGLIHRRQAAMQRALQSYDRSLAIWRELGDRRMEARTINNIALVRQLLGESDRAVDDYRRAIAIYEEVGDTVGQQIALNNIGWVHHKMLGEPRQAVGYFERALQLAQQGEDRKDQAAYLINLARAQVELGEPGAALANAGRARRLAVEIHNPDYEMGSLIVAGQARLAQDEAAAAVERFERALALGRPLGLRSRESEALFRLARARRAQGRLEEALVAIGEALAILESVRTDLDSRSLKSTFLAFRRPYYELEIALLVEQARRRAGEDSAARALAASERARARGLLETLAEAGADLSRGVDLATLDEERELRRQINEEDRRRWRAEGAERAAARRRIGELLDRLESVERRIRESSPQYAALALPRPLELPEVRREVLDDDSLLLEYSLGAEGGFLFAVSRATIEIFDLPPLALLEQEARTVYELLIDRQGWIGSDWRRHRESYRQAARRLSETVLGPVAGRLAGRRLLVAAEGPLHFIPFAALPAPGVGEWRPLVLDHEVVHLPSASALAVLRRQLAGRAEAGGLLAVLADPVFSPWDRRVAGAGEAGPPDRTATGQGPVARSARAPGLEEFPRLPHSRREAEGIAALVEPAERWVALDFAASRAAALSPRLGRYRLLHFATHGLVDSTTPQLSALALSLVDQAGGSIDGLLRLHDVYNLELSADLVVLSACQTGLGRALRGEGLVGLVRGFLHAGAGGVVASLWRIEDDATATLMERLYSGLLQAGLPPAAALRRAQIEMLSGELEPRWRHPYFWAAFVMQGEWRPM